MLIDISKSKIAVVGLGYVGLPLAVEFGKKYQVMGFDINGTRVEQLQKDLDITLETDAVSLQEAQYLSFTSNSANLSDCNIFIVTVPTPIDGHRQPDLSPLQSASKMISGLLKANDIVIYESTVYPGATEEICIPLLEKHSGLAFNIDFFVGYSPERINPGDKEHKLTSIKKITSGSTPEVAKKIDELYLSIITAGTHLAASIKIAEAAKVIENTQRDVNIALINELSMIFNILDIDTQAVLEAAGTKWNFLPFRPGLVGGHCIGVDPYYLTYKAQSVGYKPEIILAGRKINDEMGTHVTNRLIKAMSKDGIKIQDSNILILGLTFKENCPDIRNTKVIDIYTELSAYGVNVECHDPWVDAEIALREYNITMTVRPKNNFYHAIVLAVAHDSFASLGVDMIRSYGKDPHILFDLKYIFPPNKTDMRL